MNEFPFQLSVNCIEPECKIISLTCKADLRSISGRRHVYDAIWEKKNVIVKVFTHKISSRRHVMREWKGLNALSKRNINAPEPLFLGKTDKGDWVVVIEKITDSKTILDIFLNSQNHEKRLEVLMMICRELALQHKAGVLQKDFHLENFILGNNKIFTLDPGQMQFFEQDVPKDKSISNLAMLMLYLEDDDIESRKYLCEEYCKIRNLKFGNDEEKLIQKKIASQRAKGIKRGLKKCLRTSKRFISVKIHGITSVFDKTFCNESEFIDFIKQIDNLMTEGQILKDGNTCFVSHLIWNKKDIVIKRYNHKNIIHSLRHTIRGSRAIKVWLQTQRLMMLGIATPKPLAYIERRKGLVLWNSYIVTEYIKGQNLFHFQNDENISNEVQEKVQKQIDELLDKMWRFHITHGDLKQSNIIITQNGPFLTDLDSMKAHKIKLLYRLEQAKDLERFNRKIII